MTIETISDTCQCDDDDSHEAGCSDACTEDTDTSMRLPDGTRLALCFPCCNARRVREGKKPL